MDLAFSAFLVVVFFCALYGLVYYIVLERRERKEAAELWRRACLTRRQQKALERRRANGHYPRSGSKGSSAR